MTWPNWRNAREADRVALGRAYGYGYLAPAGDWALPNDEVDLSVRLDEAAQAWAKWLRHLEAHGPLYEPRTETPAESRQAHARVVADARDALREIERAAAKVTP